MARFWAVHDHLLAFIANDNSTKEVEFKNFLDNPEMTNVTSFLVDITDHLKEANHLWVDVGHKLVPEKIEMFIDDIADGKLFFLTLKKYEEDQPNAKVSHDDFEARFEDFKFDRIVLAGLVNPFVSKTLWTFEQRRNLFLSGLALQQLL